MLCLSRVCVCELGVANRSGNALGTRFRSATLCGKTGLERVTVSRRRARGSSSGADGHSFSLALTFGNWKMRRPGVTKHLPLLAVLFAATLSFQFVGWPVIKLRVFELSRTPEYFFPLAVLAVLGSVTTVYGRWGVWLLITFVLSSVQWGVALYQIFRICCSLQAITVLKLLGALAQLGDFLACCRSGLLPLRRELNTASSFEEWYRLARKADELEGKEAWRSSGDSAGLPEQFEAAQLRRSIERLHEHLESKDVLSLVLTLQSLMKRDHCGIDSPELWENCLTSSKDIVHEFDRSVLGALRAVFESPETAAKGDDGCSHRVFTLDQKIQFFTKANIAMGKSALCLSGGGSLAMYHMGVCKAMMDTGCMPKVVSGTSGGSIVAGMLAIKTDEEMQRDVFVNDISTRYADEGVRWFPPVDKQVRHFIENGVLMSNEDFAACARRYFGSFTFEEAFARTARTVNIAVTVSGASSSGGGGYGKLLLSHVTSPNVLVWSAVTASCALPGIMSPMPLMAKNHTTGKVEPFMPLGVTVCDGSLLADLPMQRLGTLFNITNFVVSQVNPHIAPFIRRQKQHPKRDHASGVGQTGSGAVSKAIFRLSNIVLTDARCSLLRKQQCRRTLAPRSNQTACQCDDGIVDEAADSRGNVVNGRSVWRFGGGTPQVRNRCVLLSKLGLIPRFFGQDVGGVFKQRYRSRAVTIVPQFSSSDTFKAILNPTQRDMARYLAEGQRAFWPHVAYTRHLLAVEHVLNTHLKRLQRRRAASTNAPRGGSPVGGRGAASMSVGGRDRNVAELPCGIDPATHSLDGSPQQHRAVGTRQRAFSVGSVGSEADAELPPSPEGHGLAPPNADRMTKRAGSPSVRTVISAEQAAAELRQAKEEIARLRAENERLRLKVADLPV